jgi:hypothetical protein
MVYVITTLSETDFAQVNESEPPVTVPPASRSVVLGLHRPFGNDIQTGEPVLPVAGERQRTRHAPLRRSGEGMRNGIGMRAHASRNGTLIDADLH